MKKIFINVNDTDEEKLFERFKQICTEEFQEFKLQVGERIHILEKKKEDPSLDIPYPAGHNWEGLTPRQVNQAYEDKDENKRTETRDTQLTI